MRRLIKILYFGSSNHLAVQKWNLNYWCKMRLVSAIFFSDIQCFSFSFGHAKLKWSGFAEIPT